MFSYATIMFLVTFSSAQQSLQIVLDVYQPGLNFKKSDPGPPDFCITVCRCVVSVITSICKALEFLIYYNKQTNKRTNKQTKASTPLTEKDEKGSNLNYFYSTEVIRELEADPAVNMGKLVQTYESLVRQTALHDCSFENSTLYVQWGP